MAVHLLKDQLKHLACEIQGCDPDPGECPYKNDFEDMPQADWNSGGIQKTRQWLYWWENGFFPAAPHRVCKYVPFQWDGKRQVMFVALRPSGGGYSSFPDEGIALFAEMLVEHHWAEPVFRGGDDAAFIFYEGVFVTDIIKCRGPVDDEVKDKFTDVPKKWKCKSYLKQELEIVRPTHIFAVGKDACRLLLSIKGEIVVGLKRPPSIGMVPHYTWGVRWPRNVEEYKRKFREAVKLQGQSRI